MVDGGSSRSEDADRSDVVRSLMGNPWPPACPTWVKAETNDNKAVQTNCISGTREDKGGSDTARDGQAEGIVMGVEPVEGSHPRHDRALDRINITRTSQLRGRPISKMRMHVHDANGLDSALPKGSGVEGTNPGVTHAPFTS